MFLVETFFSPWANWQWVARIDRRGGGVPNEFAIEFYVGPWEFLKKII